MSFKDMRRKVTTHGTGTKKIVKPNWANVSDASKALIVEAIDAFNQVIDADYDDNGDIVKGTEYTVSDLLDDIEQNMKSDEVKTLLSEISVQADKNAVDAVQATKETYEHFGRKLRTGANEMQNVKDTMFLFAEKCLSDDDAVTDDAE